MAIHSMLIEIYQEDPVPTKIEDGIRSIGNVDFIADFAQRERVGNRRIFKHILQRAAYYLHSLNTSHPFIDGNKRTSLLVTFYFLRWNGYKLVFPDNTADFLIDMAIPEKGVTLHDTYGWIVTNTNRTLWDVLRGNILNFGIKNEINVDRTSSPFGILTDIYAYEEIPQFLMEIFQRPHLRVHTIEHENEDTINISS